MIPDCKMAFPLSLPLPLPLPQMIPVPTLIYPLLHIISIPLFAPLHMLRSAPLRITCQLIVPPATCMWHR